MQLNQIIQDATQQRQELLKSQLLSKELSLFSASRKLATLDEAVLDDEIDAILPITEKLATSVNWPLLFLVLFGAAIGFIWKRKGDDSPIQTKKFTSPTAIASLRGIRRTSTFLLTLLFAWLYLKTQDSSSVFLIRTLQYSILLFLTFALMRGVLFADFMAKNTNKSSRRTILTASMIFISFSIITYAFSSDTLGRFSGSAVLYFIWLFSLTIAALSFIFMLWAVLRKIYSKRTFSPGFLIPMALYV